MRNVISELCNKFNINPGITKLNNLEFGVNIQIPINPEKFFNYVINYKGTPFHKFNIKNAKGIECEKGHYYIKIYDKGYQYNQNGNLLRFEIKVVKMQYFEKKGIKIKTISDLLNINELYHLKDVLTATFNDILIYDYSINAKELNEKQKLILSNGNNPKYWEKRLPDSKDFDGGNINKEYKKLRKKYYLELENFKKLLNKYSTSTLKNDMSILIEEKCKKLLRIEIKKEDKFTDILNIPKSIEKGQIYISNIVSSCPMINDKNQRICLNCKKDISDKKENAKFCSKKCKNDYTNPLLNPRNNLIKRIKRLNSYPVLFDNNQFIQLSNHEMKLIENQNSIYLK
ncbi:MAG: hypothetical protein NTZ33_12135 [Bacteroidetes bacterium]|nr:hypothetical protein [Bacteroidota bacterium]